MTNLLRTMRSALSHAGLAFGLLLSGHAWAQVDTYSFSPSSGTFTPLPATAQAVPAILADDAVSGAISIGFPFVFDGTSYTDVIASANGFLSFGSAPSSSGTTAYGNDLDGTTANNRPLIAPFWDDLDGRTAGAAASYTTTGTAPNRVFTFEWLNWNRYSNSGGSPAFSFQVKLYETTNVVQTVYRTESGAIVGTTPSASIGLAGIGTGIGSFLSLSDASATPTASSTTANDNVNSFPATGRIYTFTPTPLTGCPPARSVYVSSITGNSAQLNFGGNANANNYTVTVTPQGGSATTITPAPTTSPVTLSNLSINTTYTVSITPNCSSGTATPVTVTFATSNGYCVTGNGSTVLGGVCGGNNVTDVTLIGTTLNATGLTCNTPVAGTAYTNYPATGNNTATVQQGSTYTLNVTTSGNSIISAWIDYNHDLTFSASEWVQVATTSTAGTAASVSITIPTGSPVVNGPTGLRIRSRANGNPNGAPDACTQFFSGETKDFTIVITPPPACPAPAQSSLTATSVTSTTATLNFTPVSGGSGTYAVIYGPQGFNPAVPGANVVTVNPATSPLNVTGLQPGTVYQFYVQRDCGSVGTSVLVGPVNFTTTILNNDPCGATTLTMNQNGCVPFATTLVGATATTGVPAPTGCVFGTNPRDVWFKFTTPASGAGSTDARITVTGQAAGGIQALSATACAGPFTAIRCSGGSATQAAPALDLTTLTPNTTYYVRVYAYSPAVALGPFSICVTPLPSCPTPTGVATSRITKNSADVTWNVGMGSPAPGSTYTITYGAPGFNPDQAGTSITGLTGTSFSLTGLLPLTDYCYYIRLNCNGLNGSSGRVGPICFQTLQEAPANDEPCTAQTLTSGAAVSTGTTVGATTSAQPGIGAPTCGAATTPRDVWYSVTMPPATVGTDSLVLDLNGATAGMVRIFTATSCSAGPFTLVRCQAATGSNTGFSAPIRIGQLMPGTTYYIAVSGYGNSDAAGSFTIGATTFYVGPTCNPVTALAVGSITTTAASVSFTPGANNTSYTVTYGPTNGTATTTTTTTSPLALSGLTPGTAYTVTVTPICSNGGSAAGVTTTFNTVAPTCDPITNLTLTNVLSDSLTVNFTAGAGNTSYSISYTAAGGATTVVTANASPVLLTNLIPGTVYTVTVTPVCAAGGTAAGVTATATTAPAICNGITSLSVDANSITPTTADVLFVAGRNNTSFSLSYVPASGGTPQTTTATGSPVQLSGLTPGTVYNLTVTPTCSAGGTAPVSNLTFSTPCEDVTGVSVVRLGPTAADVFFTIGQGNTSVSITYTTSGGNSQTVTATTSPVRLGNLLPGTQYTVNIVPTCATGGAPGNGNVTFSTNGLATRSSLSSADVQLFPNPAHHNVTLTLPALAARTAQVSIVNALGQVLSTQGLTLNAAGTETKLDVSQLPSGMYIVQVQANNQTARVRLVVE